MKYQNPIIRGFNPDPSICRVGKDFYLVTSSFEYFPGIPVYHSRDLINWEQIGNCIDRAGMLPFEKSLPGGGIWAPTIRYNKGRFYVTASFMDYNNFIVSSENPSTCWSNPIIVNMGGLDPSILFDGEKTYYCTNYRTNKNTESISLAEINADTGELLSDIKTIWNGCAADRPQYLEAPHIYHIGDWYYLLAAEGGSMQNHMITAARSSRIWGPYETLKNNPVLTNRYSLGEVSCSGHGDLVEDEDGNWWIVHLAMRPCDDWYSHIGRETFLLPVSWKKGLPYISDGKSHIECDAPLKTEQKTRTGFTADFEKLQPQWLFLREPETNNYQFGRQLILKPSRVKISDNEGSPTFIAVRQPDIDCTAETEFEFNPTSDGCEAGLTIYISSSGYYVFCKKREDNSDCILIYKNGNRIISKINNIPAGKLRLKVTASRKGYDMYYAIGGSEYIKAGETYALKKNDADKCFTGTLIGLYVQCEFASDEEMVISEFSI